MQKANIYMYGSLAGILVEDSEGYHYTYNKDYLEDNDNEAISLTLPLQEKTFSSLTLFPFFDGLIPEGWLLDIVANNWKLDPRDRMAVLMVTCTDCIGAVTVEAIKNNDDD